MNLNQLHLPFTIDNDNTGLTEVEGILHPEEEGLRVEWQMKDAIFGVVKGKAKSINIPYGEVGDAVFKSSFWGTSLTLRLNSLEIASQVPLSKAGRIKLKVKRRDREIGQALQFYLEEKLGMERKQLPGDDRPRPFYE